MRRGRLVTLCAALALAAWALAPEFALAIDPGGAALVRTSAGRSYFVVDNPAGPVSPAALTGRRADKSGAPASPLPGYVLSNRVIARAANEATISSAVSGTPNATVRKFPLRDYWIVTTASVEAAIAAADTLASAPGVAAAYVDSRAPIQLRDVPNDFYFPNQWHLKNTQVLEADVNAEPAWDAGYTGAGVTIGIVEGGWQTNHPDLAPNFNALATQPGGTATSHATSCAGVAAAAGNNTIGVAGVAYGAQISAQIYGTDSETAAALTFANDLNDIKSNSWGPFDHTTTAQPTILRDALADGVQNGRGGLGEIYTWADGNGGPSDRVDYDGYASCRYVLPIGAIGDLDYKASYGEPGSSKLVVAHSSGNVRSIYTTYTNFGYTSGFGGTSSASPLAAGVVALMLQANPNLTWRDAAHVLVESARKCDAADPGWTVNGAGRAINYFYGYGAVDAAAITSLAATWKNVSHEVVADSGIIAVNQSIPDNDPSGLTQTLEFPEDLRIETVELVLNVAISAVGDLKIVLYSPAGTESLLADVRSAFEQDYDNFIFTSRRCWDENSAGTWTVSISDGASGDVGEWLDYELKIYGTPVCTGDLDHDGQIALLDLARMLSIYGACEDQAGFDPEADIDNSGCIDLSDLASLLTVYGTTCP